MASFDPGMVIEQIVADYERPLRRLAKCYTRESSIAEDLFQEIVLALCGAFAISFAAKGRRDRLRLRPLTEADSVVNEGQETRDRALLLAAVRKLQMADQQLVMLYLEGLSAVEMEIRCKIFGKAILNLFKGLNESWRTVNG